MNKTILNEDMRGVYKALVAMVMTLLLGFFGAMTACWMLMQLIVQFGGGS